MVAAAPDRVQMHSTSATSAIPEDPNIKVVFAATGDRMQVLVDATTRDTYTVTIVIHKSQVAIPSKKGATLVDKYRKSY